MTDVQIAGLIISAALELLGMGKDWLSGKPPTPERVEAVWASLEQVKAKLHTDAIRRARFGDGGPA